MIQTQDLDKLVNKLAQLLPMGDSALSKDIKKNIRALLDSSFQKMDLVSREEYEVQKALLARTQERLLELQKRIEQLESEQ
jgi:ubiquinone biosynthesis accessory factor UbiK